MNSPKPDSTYSPETDSPEPEMSYIYLSSNIYYYGKEQLFVGINTANNERGYTQLNIRRPINYDINQTNAEFDNGIDGNVFVTITNSANLTVTLPVYIKKNDTIIIPNDNIIPLTIEVTGEQPIPVPIETFPIVYPDTPVPSPQWRFECKENGECKPTKTKNLSPNIYDDIDTCLAACGVPEEDKVSNILSIVSLVLASFVLLLIVLLGLFAGDVDTGTTKFFKGLAVFLVITTVILLSVVAYRIP